MEKNLQDQILAIAHRALLQRNKVSPGKQGNAQLAGYMTSALEQILDLVKNDQ